MKLKIMEVWFNRAYHGSITNLEIMSISGYDYCLDSNRMKLIIQNALDLLDFDKRFRSPDTIGIDVDVVINGEHFLNIWVMRSGEVIITRSSDHKHVILREGKRYEA